MIVTCAHASRLVGDEQGTRDLLSGEVVARERSIELENADTDVTCEAAARLSLVSTRLSQSPLRGNDFQIAIHIDNTPEGLSAAQALLAGMGRSAMAVPSSEQTLNPAARPPIAFVPTAGGIAIGCRGGVGLGLALDAIRNTANGSGNPVLGGLAIGLGLFGTAIVAAAGATAALPVIKIPGLGQLSFKSLT